MLQTGQEQVAAGIGSPSFPPSRGIGPYAAGDSEEWTELRGTEEDQVEEIMAGLRVLTLLWILDSVLPHDGSKNLDSTNTTLPDFSSLNQTSGGELLTASLSQTGGKLNSSPTVNVYGTLVTSTTRLPVTSTEDFFVSPTPTEDKSALSMAAVGKQLGHWEEVS
uniref:Uncharacterized protein n=1 Tax=Sphaerodactylus townsendi TaxID=933632 RepID=A0ACB8EBU9_9SAUR